MAINRSDLWTIIDADPAERENLFRYHRANGTFPGMSDHNARLTFERNLAAHTPDADAYMGVYLPVYNALHVPARAAPAPGRVRIAGNDLDARLVKAAATTAAVAGAGLVGIVLGPDGNNAASQALDAASKAAIATSPLWGMNGCVTNKRVRNAAKTGFGIATAGIAGFFVSQGIDNDTVRDLANLASQTAVYMSPIAAAIRYWRE